MKTEVVKLSNHNQEKTIAQVARAIKSGKLVALPTETVYGIAVNLNKKSSVEKLYEIKQRDKSKPFTLHIVGVEEVEKYAANINPYAWRLMYRNWPGPLTAILEDKNKNSVGLRAPNHYFTINVLAQVGEPVGMPSANLSGSNPPTKAEEVLRDLEGKIDILVDAGNADIGQESTVVDLRTAEPKLLREGAIKFSAIKEEALRKKILFVCTGNSCRSVMAEYYFNKKAKDNPNLEASSAGISAYEGSPTTKETLEVLKQDGIDVSGHRAKKVDLRMLREADLVLVMSRDHEWRLSSAYPQAKNKVYLLKEFAKINDNELDIQDPIANSFDFYKKTYNIIRECVIKIIEIM